MVIFHSPLYVYQRVSHRQMKTHGETRSENDLQSRWFFHIYARRVRQVDAQNYLDDLLGWLEGYNNKVFMGWNKVRHMKPIQQTWRLSSCNSHGYMRRFLVLLNMESQLAMPHRPFMSQFYQMVLGTADILIPKNRMLKCRYITIFKGK